jgi:hypothetical protein
MWSALQRVEQIRVALWGAPWLVAAVWGCWAALRPEYGLEVPLVAALAGGLAWLWFVYVFGVSRFGVAHGLCAPGVLALILLWPLSQALAPALLALPTGHIASFDGATLGLHLLCLGAAAAAHARRAPLPAVSNAPGPRLHWPGLEVDLRRRRIASTPPQGARWWVDALLGGLASVLLFAWMKATLAASGQVLLAVVLMHGVSLCLYAGPLGRQLGQALRLRQLEKRLSGAPFCHEKLPELLRLRRQSWLVRLLRRLGAD